MKVLQVNKTNVYDIFQGEGWKVWSRYKLKNNIYTHLSGEKLPRILVEQFKQVVSIGLPKIFKLVPNVLN